MQEFSLNLGDKKIQCRAMGVEDHLRLEGDVTHILSKGLQAALGKEVADLFKDEADSDDGDIISGVLSVFKFREATDWAALTELIKRCVENCELVSKKEGGGEYVESLMLSDLDALKREHYLVFGWFLECQLGNFTAWQTVKTLILESLKGIATGALTSSAE